MDILHKAADTALVAKIVFSPLLHPGVSAELNTDARIEKRLLPQTGQQRFIIIDCASSKISGSAEKATFVPVSSVAATDHLKVRVLALRRIKRC